ncbi:MAG: PH domain-containing protein [Microgenomates group bacterium]
MPDIFVTHEEKKINISETRKKIKEELNQLLGKSSQFLASFIPQPRNLRFETQEKEEKIILLLRRHPITLLPWVILVVLLLVAPFFLLKVISFEFLPENFRIVFFLSWYLFTFALAFEKFLTWFFNVNILTDERIIDINFPTLLYREISEAKLDRIQDVSVKTGGYIRSLFNFGDVTIQTAGAVPEICFEDVPNPQRVSQVINQLLYEEELEKMEGRVK